MMTSGELFCMGSIVGALILGGILAAMTTIRSSQISRREESGVYLEPVGSADDNPFDPSAFGECCENPNYRDQYNHDTVQCISCHTIRRVES